MEKRQFVGKNLEDALNQAARDFDTERENLGYAILPEAGGGLLKKLLFRSIRVEAWIEHASDLQAAARQAVREAIEGDQRPSNGRSERNDRNRNDRGKNRKGQGNSHKLPDASPRDTDTQKRRSDQAPARGPKTEGARRGPRQNDQGSRRPAPPAGEDDRNKGPSVTFGTEGVEDLLHTYTAAFLKVFDADLSQAQMTRSESGDMTVSVASEALEDLLQRSDKLSSSFEHVFKRLVQKKYGDLAERLVLDAGEATAKRIEGLQELARNLANKVIETGKSVTLNSRSGQERRVIHLTIDEIEGVATRSIGSGDGRKLVIYSTAQDEARRQQRNEAKSQADTPDETGASRRSRSGNRGRRGRGSGRGQGAGRTQGRAEGSY